MKASEFRKLIREEVRKVVSELQKDPNDMTSAELDRMMTKQKRELALKAKEYVNTPAGKELMVAIKTLIKKPYGYSDLEDLLEKFKPSKENFKFAAQAAGMKFSGSGAGIAIFDDTYQDPDVSIDYVGNKWRVG